MFSHFYNSPFTVSDRASEEQVMREGKESVNVYPGRVKAQLSSRNIHPVTWIDRVYLTE